MASHNRGGLQDGTTPRRRIPTVDEAMTFTPLSSIIPFDAEVVPAPVAWPGTAPLRLLSNDQAAAANRLLSSLDKEAGRAETASGRLQQTLADVQKLLSRKDAPQYKLKSSLKGLSTRTDTAAPAQSAGQQPHPLGAFARRVIETARLPPIEPVSSLPNPHASARQPSTSHAHVKPRFHDEAPPQSSPLSPLRSSQVAPPTPLHRQPPTSTPRNDHVTPIPRTFVINNPVLSQEQLAQYERGPEPQIRTYAPATSNAATNDAVPDRAALAAQRQKAGLAVSRLQMLANDIFEGEIQFQSDRQHAGEIFTMADTNEGSAAILSPAMQASLDKAITSVVRYKALGDMPVDDLLRLQKLCYATIRTTEDRYLGVGDGWDETDISEWTFKLAVAEQGLTAARTILRIMGSGTEEKVLFSEDILTSLLNFIRNVTDTLVVSVVELRSSAESDSPFQVAHRHRSRLVSFFRSIGKVVALLGNVFFKVDMDETAVTAVETLCTTLLFVENAPSEAESALGIQSFETLRRTAMDALAKLFARNKGQRQSIFDDILTSLERLPVGRQSARQYKLSDAKPIQLVSALLMRLVQTSTMIDDAKSLRDRRPASGREDDDDDESEDEESEEDADYDSADESHSARKRKQKRKPKTGTGSDEDLEILVTPLYDAAVNHARYVTHFLVSRAINSSKSSGEPYRNLLDIFVEDFINVLGKTDWPAAELLLRQLLQRFYEITENAKSSAPSKAMALELMGAMLTGITDIRLHTAEAFDKHIDDSTVLEHLKSIHTAIANDEATEQETLALDGPYRAVVEYIRVRADAEQQDANLATALSYHFVQWGHQIVKPFGRESSEPLQSALHTNQAITQAIRNPQHQDLDGTVYSIRTEEARLGAALLTLRLPVGRLFNQIFNKLLTSMSSDQASLRSKSLRSVEDVLQKDPSILDRGGFVLQNIVRCMTDSSTQVRDAALGLLATCLQLRPKLDVNAFEHILRRASDSASVVKKRAIKLSKDIYLRNDSIPLRSKVADALIHCVSDIEPTVVELARQTIEDVWIAPYHTMVRSDPDDARAKTKLAQQTSLIVETVKRSPDVIDVLQDLLEDVMSPKSKTSTSNIAVCKAFVLLMVDAVIDETALPSRPPRAVTMKTLAIFSQARPKLFTSAQLQPLLPYLKNLQSTDDLDVYRYTIIILRCTLPHISNLPRTVLTETQASLLNSVAKLPAPELKEATTCLWALAQMSGAPERLIALTRSSMEGLKMRSTHDLKNDQTARQVERLLLLVGSCVGAFDLDAHLETFKAKLPDKDAKQVASLAVSIVCPLTSPKSPPVIRSTAVKSLLQLCQAWPKEYKRTDVSKAIELVLSSDDQGLQLVLMTAWREFFIPGTDRRPVEDMTNGSQAAVGADRIKQTYLATDRDGASTAIAQRFMSDIIRISLNASTELSTMAAHVVININKLGMVHPRESASALVALQTSPDAAIARAAAEEHGALFSKYESIFEKETVRAVQQAFVYQRDTIKDLKGYTGQPPVAKLHLFWDILKTCKAKVRQKFVTNISTHMDFEYGKLDLTGKLPSHVGLVAFCVQNLAMFDYITLQDLTLLVDGLEKVFSATGTAVAHGVEGSLLNNTIEAVNCQIPHAHGAPNGVNGETLDGVSLPIRETITLADDVTTVAAQTKPVNPELLRSLAAGSQVLLLLFELRTFLRRGYSLSKPPGGQRGRPPKDPNKAKDKEEKAKAPQRVPNATLMAERFLARTEEIVKAYETSDGQRRICLQFQEKISIDDEVRVKPEDAEDVGMGDEPGFLGGIGNYGDRATPSLDGEESSAAGTPAKRGRKRKSATPAGTPRKKKKRSIGDDDDWD
ncbi:sister chromatid cohesion C-terminus-domain-containing protein [Elsinoe ampelina]|uniref:Sister chromatid cohesion protein n=1 Tax=Elsinoe ampelina TaxID=302913 RepID=A0A6A6GQT3_9PEZI|nr:sister chromatid cohesion C-terminus-domain-containing protein [Elsinoe ampelina]